MQLKFRVWDKLQKKMFYMGDAINTFLVGSGAHADEIQKWYGYDIVDERLIWMLWTGLKDKNGKEIYEEDILRIKYHYEEEDYNIYKCKVFYSHLNIILINKSFKFNLLDDISEIEIIGNVYENPELLESEKDG